MSPTPSLLLVDDDLHFRDSLELLLSCHFTVHVASSAEDALCQLRGGLSPALILSDLSMPGIGGLGLLHGMPAPMRPRLAFLSAGSSDPHIHSAILLSKRPLLPKPVRFLALMDTLWALLDSSPQHTDHIPGPAWGAPVAVTA